MATSAGLAGCAYGPYGGVSVGAGHGSLGYDYGYGPYGYGYGDPFGYGYYGGYPYFGWYDGFYYPGAGFYVYDRYGCAHHWDRKQESHWGDILRDAKRRSGVTGTAETKENWSGFSAKAATATNADQQRSLATIRERIRANQVEMQAARQANAEVNARANAGGSATADRGSLDRIQQARRQAIAERQQSIAQRQQAQGEARAARVERQQQRQDSFGDSSSGRGGERRSHGRPRE
nr:hypothetical protein [Sphingomonas alba]